MRNTMRATIFIHVNGLIEIEAGRGKTKRTIVSALLGKMRKNANQDKNTAATSPIE